MGREIIHLQVDGHFLKMGKLAFQVEEAGNNKLTNDLKWRSQYKTLLNSIMIS